MSRSTAKKVMTNLLLLIERMALASIMGMLFFASTQPKGAEAEIIINGVHSGNGDAYIPADIANKTFYKPFFVARGRSKRLPQSHNGQRGRYIRLVSWHGRRNRL